MAHLPLILQADKDQRAQLYDCIRSHVVTLRGCKTGSKVIWLLYVSSELLSLHNLMKLISLLAIEWSVNYDIFVCL
jgi:hypothetical protein